MNIFLIGNAYPPTYMGGESVHLYNLATGLKKRGHRVFVGYPASSSDGKESVTLSRPEPQIDVYRICSRNESGEHLESINKAFLDIFEGLLRQGTNLDLVHCHSNKFSSGVKALAERYPTPVVTTIHAIDIPMVHDLIIRKGVSVGSHDLAFYTEDTRRTKALCAKSDRVIAISRAMASLIPRYYDTNPQKIEIVYHGIDVDQLANYSDEREIEAIRKNLKIDDRTVILFVGRIEPYKGVQPLAAACKLLCEKYDDIAFIFLGNGSAQGWLRSYLSEAKNLHFVNWLSFDKVIPYYHLADIAIVPSLIEAFGLVPIEAMACGTCVISSDADGLDEIITDNRNGIKVPLVVDEWGDRQIGVEDIFSALEKAIFQPEWRRSMANQGLLRAREFSLDRMAAGVEKVYFSATGQRPA